MLATIDQLAFHKLSYLEIRDIDVASGDHEMKTHYNYLKKN